MGGTTVAIGGTTYAAVDDPAGPSMAAIDGPAGPSTANFVAIDGPAGPVVGDHRWRDRSLTQIAYAF